MATLTDDFTAADIGPDPDLEWTEVEVPDSRFGGVIRHQDDTEIECSIDREEGTFTLAVTIPCDPKRGFVFDGIDPIVDLVREGFTQP